MQSVILLTSRPNYERESRNRQTIGHPQETARSPIPLTRNKLAGNPFKVFNIAIPIQMRSLCVRGLIQLCAPTSSRRSRSTRRAASLSATLVCVLTLLCCILSGCRRHHPSIAFTQVPITDFGGADTHGTLSGTVQDAPPGSRIVLYVRAGRSWWIQPFIYRPFTTIQPDGHWTSGTHLGLEFAALLVDPNYKPGKLLVSLPGVGNGVLAITTIPAQQTILEHTVFRPKNVRFSGYDWIVQSRPDPNGGKIHYYDPDNVWVDQAGSLHLRVTHVANKWVCAEVRTSRTLGFGSYRFVVHDIAQFEPAATLGLFTWGPTGPDQSSRELDVHFSRWGNPDNKTGEFVVQPYYVPSNVYRFDAPPGPLTAGFDWTAGKSTFLVARGARDVDQESKKPLATWTFTTGIPPTGDEHLYVNLCEFAYGKLPMQHEAEVVLDRFQFLP